MTHQPWDSEPERTYTQSEMDAAKKEAAAPRLCNVCCGKPLKSGRTCICGGKGTEQGEMDGLRIELHRLEAELAKLREPGPVELRVALEAALAEYCEITDASRGVVTDLRSVFSPKAIALKLLPVVCASLAERDARVRAGALLAASKECELEAALYRVHGDEDMAERFDLLAEHIRALLEPEDRLALERFAEERVVNLRKSLAEIAEFAEGQNVFRFSRKEFELIARKARLAAADNVPNAGREETKS